MCSRTLRKTLTMPKATATTSRQLVPWPASHAQMMLTSPAKCCEALGAGLRDALRGRVDGGERLLRRAADLDVGHGVQRRHVVIGPRPKNILLLSGLAAPAERGLAE